MKTSYKTAISILILTVLWMVSGLFSGSVPTTTESPDATKQVHMPRVRVMTIVGELHTQSIRVMGRIQADQAVSIRAQVLGHVSDVVVSKGDRVNVGDVILHIDVEDRKGLLAESRARLKQREIAYEAARKLRQGGYSSQLTEAKAKADLEAARAQVTRMKRNLDNTTVKAPLAGVIDTLPVKAGDYFDKAGGLVGRIVDLTKMVALGQVAERNIQDIALGKPAMVRLPDGRELSGLVSYISSASNALTRTFGVEVTLDIADETVREGITAEIQLPMKTLFSHRLSSALLTLDAEGKVGVKTINADNIVEFHSVKVVSDTKDGMWLSGLPTKIVVISVGQDFVSVGQTVDPVEGNLKSMISQPRQGN